MALSCFRGVLFLSFLLIFSLSAVSFAESSGKGSAKAYSTNTKEKSSFERSTTPSPLVQGIDSIFINMKMELDQVVESPLLRGKSISSIDGYFLKVIKGHQPFYSLTRVNRKGDVVNEVIRLVEKNDVKKQNFAKAPWFKRAAAKHKEYSGMFKLEETGRYYLLWAAPMIDTSAKGKVSFEGAVVLKIDLWDCFHKYANMIETPFLVRIDRLHLYSNKWKDTIAYKEGALSVPGVNKIFVRYPKAASTVVAAVTPVPAVIIPAASPAVDSTRIKAVQDSIKVAKMKLDKKNKNRKIVIITALIALIIIVMILIFVIVPIIKQKMIMRNIDREDAL